MYPIQVVFNYITLLKKILNMKKKNPEIIDLNNLKLLSSKVKTAIFCCLIFFGITLESVSQLDSFLINMQPGDNYYLIRDQMETYLDSLETITDSVYFYSGGGPFKEFKKFEKKWEPLVSPHGDFTKYFDAENNYYSNLQNTYDYINEDPWHELGPNIVNQSNTNKGTGPVEFVTFFDDGTSLSTQYMLSGSLTSGLFYSSDFGETWSKTGTDTEWARSGCSWAVFHPTNHQIWYASSSGNSSSGRSHPIGKTGGIYRTTDEGISWYQIADKDDFLDETTIIYKLIIDPEYPSTLFVVTSEGVYKTIDCEVEYPVWTLKLPGFTYDLEMKPDNNATLYSSTFYDGSWKIMKSINSGDDWDPISIQPETLLINNIDEQFFTIEVSKAKPDYLYCIAKEKNNYSLYYKDFSTVSDWNHIASRTDPYGYGGGHGFGVEQVANGEYIFISYYTSLCKYSIYSESPIPYEVEHVDVEDIIYHPYNSNEIWACTHGGVEKSINGGEIWQPKYDGLGVAQVQNMATSFTNPELILTGLYHDGMQLTNSDYEPGWLPVWNWLNTLGVDGMKPLIDNKNPNYMWGSGQQGIWEYSDDSFNTSTRVSLQYTAYWLTIGALNKENSYIFFRNKFENNENEEVFRAANRGILHPNDCFISSFGSFFPPSHRINILGLSTPHNNGDYLYVDLYDENPITETRTWHLFVSKNASDWENTVEWEKLTIPRSDVRIYSIDFDPLNPDIIYLAYSGSSNENKAPYANEMIFKIDYTNPVADITDISDNLPLTAAREECIAVEWSHMGGIYFATEFGIFYTNNNLLENEEYEWQLFGKSFPHVACNGIEINYFGNTLRAGTWGRGAWEHELYCFQEETPLVINEDISWDQFLRLDRSIVVKPGHTLTINQNARIMMPEGSRIVVEPGGKLELDGGVISNACQGLWEGIEVWGNPDLPQTPLNQGIIAITNEGTIERANVAVRLGKTLIPDGEGEIMYGDGGGLIFATEAIIRNNRTGVVFEAYNNDNISYFNKCTFETTGQLLADAIPLNLAVLNMVEGITFKGCTFRNSREYTVPYSDRGNGIYSFNSNFYVDEICVSGSPECTQYQSTAFEALEYGIRAYGATSIINLSIKNSIFSKVEKGIFISAVNNFIISNNLIDMIGLNIYGIYLDCCTGYTVEDNLLEGTYPLSATQIGIVVNNSGDAPNEIYRNTFERLSYGILAQNENRAPDGTGLVLKCNEYFTCNFDKVISWEGPRITSRTGIAENQGSSSSNAEDMAGNIFDIHGHTANGDFDDILNEANNITYFYPFNTEEGDVRPIDYTQNTVTLEIKEILPDDWTFDDGCPPSEEVIGEGISDIKTKMAGTGQLIDSTQNLLALLVDGGNTDVLQSDVDNSTPPETMSVYTELMEKSPYLSDTVVSTAIDKEDVLPGVMIRDIMVANPNTAKSNDLISKLDERLEPLPDYMVAQILAGRSIVSIREETESKLAAFKLERAKYYNILERYYLTDTLDPQTSRDSLLVLFQDENSLNTKYRLAFYLMAQGAWIDGFATLNGIPTEFELTPSDVEEHNQLADYATLLFELKQQDKELLWADSTQIATLTTLACNELSMASVYARNVLLALKLIAYNEPIILPDLFKSSEILIEYNEILEKGNNIPTQLTIQPNPARNYLIINYELEQEAGILIEISDMEGKVKFAKRPTNLLDQFSIDIQGWETGIYFATLKINGKLTETVKFLIVD